jgi:hypothetical protein
VRDFRFAPLLAFALLANAGVIACGAPEMSAIDSSLEPQPLNDSDTVRQKSNRLTDLEQVGLLPTSGADAPGPVIPAGGAPVAVHVSSGHSLGSPAVSAWLAHGRLFFCPTLLPSGLFRPPRLSS